MSVRKIVLPKTDQSDERPVRERTRFEARWRTPDGRDRSKRFRKEADAKRHERQQLELLERGEWIDPRTAKMTFGDLAARWRTTVDLKPKTLAGYESILSKHLLPRWESRAIGTIDPFAVDELVADLRRDGVAPGTIRNVVNLAKGMFRHAERWGLLRSNPCAGVAIPKSPRSEMLFIDASEVEALAAAIEHPYGTLVRFAAYTGLRAGEIAALRVRRLSLLRGSVDVRESVAEVHGALVFGETKTGARRSVALPRFLCDELAVHLAERNIDTKPDDLVFTSPDGGPLRQSNFYRRTFKPAVLRSGLPAELRFHDLRHTAVALLVAQGAHPLAVKERLGHSSITTTMDRYGHLFPSLDESLTEGLDAARAAAVAEDPVGFEWVLPEPVDMRKVRSGR